jgi:hypothetical protein
MRLVNRLLAFALVLAIAALGFVVAVEATWTGLGYRFLWFPGKQWLHTLRSTDWSARSVLVVGAAAAVLGLLLLIVEVRPRPKRLAQMSVEGDDVWLLQRRTTERHLSRKMQGKLPSSPAVEAKLQVKPSHWRLVLRTKGNEETRVTLESLGQQDLEKLFAPPGSKATAKVTPEGRAP